MNEIVQIPFHGTFLHTTLDEDGQPVVVLKPTIKGMGLDWSAQWTKLQRRSWAVVGQTPTTGPDGKTYQMATCDLDTWSMLLANIDENKVKEGVRDLVVRYQKESAQRLREYWTTGMAINPAVAANLPAEPTRKELAKYWYEAEERAERAEVRAEVAEGKFRAIEAGDGLTLTAFHKKYLSEVTERTFFEHLYSRGYLIDQRGKGSQREDGTFRDGPEHRHPTFKGKPFFYLHGSGVHGNRRRENTRVRPGDPELLLKAALVKDGLRGNQHTVGHLFAIEGGAS
ncbi:phage antirepressor N-terminal domain-containing protein [Nonomuraea sp. NPDC052116]|uniref:phage antirepressor N-terminal domain-containing protein n=1 Tax=Nonomuraea sp. NPDC052116 TaxID=3155665 RepID=UPI00343C432E